MFPVEVTINLILDIVMESFNLGSLEKLCITTPPIVSKLLCSKSHSHSLLKSSIGVSAETKYSFFEIGFMKSICSSSYSSSISPTISSRTSSIVTRPVTPPY